MRTLKELRNVKVADMTDDERRLIVRNAVASLSDEMERNRAAIERILGDITDRIAPATSQTETEPGLRDLARAERDALLTARRIPNGANIRRLVGTFDGYAYARTTHVVLRRKLDLRADFVWSVFCGVAAWPENADPRAVITEQLARVASVDR